jgi:hypothetical protein
MSKKQVKQVKMDATQWARTMLDINIGEVPVPDGWERHQIIIRAVSSGQEKQQDKEEVDDKTLEK